MKREFVIGDTHLAVAAAAFVAEGLLVTGRMVLDSTDATVQATAIPDGMRARVMGVFGFTAAAAGRWARHWAASWRRSSACERRSGSVGRAPA